MAVAQGLKHQQAGRLPVAALRVVLLGLFDQNLPKPGPSAAAVRSVPRPACTKAPMACGARRPTPDPAQPGRADRWATPGAFPSLRSLADGAPDKERRLLYVAMTRAQDTLAVITLAVMRAPSPPAAARGRSATCSQRPG